MVSSEHETNRAVTDYLASLTWDGKPRLDRWLVVCAGAEDSPHVRAASRRMLVAAVRRARDPGCRLDQLPVLVGPQGSGKSEALRVLGVVDAWFSDDVLPRCGADVRQLIEATAGKWLVEVSELGGMSRSDVADLKALLSQTCDEVRGPHERVTTRVPRRFVVVGTTSREDFLQDATDNRRFVPVRIQRFDLGLLREVRDQLWAEAVVVEATGESIDFAGQGEDANAG